MFIYLILFSRARAVFIELDSQSVHAAATQFRRPVASLFAMFLLALTSASVDAKQLNAEGDGRKFNITNERHLDESNQFVDPSKYFGLTNPENNKEWWQRLLSGEVGKDRFLILCALKDGNWKRLGDIRDFIEFQDRKNLRAPKLQEMLIRMAGRQLAWSKYREGMKLKVGEGWLEKSPDAMSWGIESEWRIPTNVLPFLQILLMGCPSDNRCE